MGDRTAITGDTLIIMHKSAFLIATACLAACASPPRTPDPTIVNALDPTSMQVAGSAFSDNYRIGPTDKLSLSVFQVPDLSFEEIVVDASGNLQLPLIGSVQAAGRTPNELSSEIALRLGERYLRNPQVSVTVAEAASQKVTVDGAVTKPGVYEMRGRTTLLQAIAMAEGPTRVASLEKVAVFRTVDGRRAVAAFDLNAIRSGQAADPVLAGDDIVIVDTSRMNVAVRDIVAALPGLAVFTYFR